MPADAHPVFAPGPVAQPSPTAADDPAFLQNLGDRLRLLRARRGMTRRALSQQSGVSERYIAQFEAGAGNVSVLLLRRVAHALGVGMAGLVAERPEPPQELVLVEQFLGRLSSPRLAEARALLLAHFAAFETGARQTRIALIGLRGAGKSSLGRSLAAQRGVKFIELDREIEAAARMELRDIFEVHGQDGFRRLERDTLARIVHELPAVVIATGGGLVTEPGTFELLLSHCRCVWVRAAPEEHMRRVVAQGDQRPMQDNRRSMDDLRAILSSREPLYAQADLVLETTGRSLLQSEEELVRLLG